MKILIIADFHGDSPRFLLNNSRFFSKGFVRNGHDVRQFSYRETLLGLSPIRSKKWALKLAKKKTDRLLAELARHYQPDLVFITTFRLLDVDTIAQLKAEIGGAKVMCWYGDGPLDIEAGVAPIAQQCDWFLATSGGDILEEFRRLGVARCAFMPNPCDGDTEYPRAVDDRWRSDIVFTGKLKHKRAGQDSTRWELINTLVEKKGMSVWGDMGKPRLEGQDYLNALCGAKMVLSINVYNDVRLYHSDRLIHCVSCGVFTLARHVPDSELLFEDGEHLRYFRTADECLELVDYYLGHDDERGRIAAAGREHAQAVFDCGRLAEHVIDLIEKGSYDAPFAEIVGAR